ncbi:endothelin-3b isoform X2 [Betta splendens]|uniref:Endothelin-3 n=1 Tax=Betta splendens TaxID=158456 RepID=A0A8M1HGS8_BETSP|nr:endothelin-3b isoform X2 [Betta splendens]
MLFQLLALITAQGLLTPHAAVSCGLVEPGGRADPSGAARADGAPGAPRSEAKARPKRCTCYSYKDKECVYYCHLDIIWINTPERTVPYGMSSYQGLQRVQRAVGGRPAQHEGTKSQRCVCAELHGDPECRDFCLTPDPPWMSAGCHDTATV